ncbi:MAG: AarF/ABC1/UbiB kinase family protein [bacterium]|nr:AarF/ABC1/UbiB kinase family protein [bacterium]
MEPKQTELMDALAARLAASGGIVTSASLPSLLQDLGQRRVPVGRFHRARIIGASQVKIATKYVSGWLRTCYKGVDAREQQRSETRLKAALELLSSMAYMRGTVMKIGQLLASYPNLAPEEFSDVLYPLHFEAPPMHFSLLREFVHNELGADPEELFDDFETNAFAAASLGQVHRARLKGSGERVAIKIQYPSIGRTIRDDFQNLKTLIFPMRLSGDWDNLKRVFEGVRTMLERETDYVQEAANLRQARAAVGDEEGIVIPKVYPEFSTKRVLTMEYIDGVHLDAFLEGDPPQEVRDEFGEKMSLVCARLQYGASMMYADPQPGNYYFMPDGRLGVVDFGCCYHFSDEDIDYITELEAAMRTSREAVRKAILRAMDAKPGQRVAPEHMQLMEQLCDWFWQPIRHEGPFDFGDPEFFRSGLRLLAEILRSGHRRSLPVNYWNNRGFMGLRAMLCRLKARVDFNTLLKKESAQQYRKPGP